MSNIQITIDDRILAEIRKAGGSSEQDVTRVIQEALEAWLSRGKGTQFEREWIAALQKNPDEASRAEDWLESRDYVAR